MTPKWHLSGAGNLGDLRLPLRFSRATYDDGACAESDAPSSVGLTSAWRGARQRSYAATDVTEKQLSSTPESVAP